MRDPRVLQLIMDSLRYWVVDMHVDGFSLRPGEARWRASCTRSTSWARSRHHPAGSRAVAGEADCRTVGLGEGGYQVGNFPPAGPVERPLPRLRCASSGAAMAAGVATGEPSGRQQRPLRPGRAAPVREHQLRHEPRRVHAARPGQLQHEAQRGQRRRQPDGEVHNLSWNCGVEGHKKTPPSSSCARARCATSWPRCSFPRACRC